MKKLLFLVLPALLATLSAYSQTTVTFRQGLNGYAGVRDTMLQKSAATTNAGTRTTMDVVGGTAEKQGLLKFEGVIGAGANQIPPGAQILSAKLQLSVWRAGAGVAVHRMNAEWSESSTWNSMGDGLQIGDDEAHWSAVDTKTSLPIGLAEFNVLTTVQEWSNAAEVNQGWALLPAGTGTTAVQIDTRESTFTSGKSWNIQPTLVVTYTGGGSGGAPTISAVAPADNATNVGSNGKVNLEVAIADPDDDALNVTFYGREESSGGGGVAGPDFTLVMIPDTQFYAENGSSGKIADFRNMTTWMVANRQALNIQFVAHMGDMVQNRDDDEQEWINADSAMDIIENPATTTLTHGIPWGGAPGNHDMNRSGGANKFWNQYFGNSRWAGKTYYRGGYSNNTSDANYQFFSASGMDFIVVNMHYRAPAAMIQWADALLKAHPNRRAIVTSHEILQAHEDAGTPVDQAPYYGQGKAIFDGLKNNPNLFLMLCGHWHGEARRTEVYQGRNIHAVLCNYQTEANGGDTWLRYLVFSPNNNNITSNVIRTRDGARRTTNISQFTLDYPMSAAGPQWTALGTVSRPQGSTNATLEWNGIVAGKQYEWYAAASDGGQPASTSPRSFTAGNNTPPTVALTAPANGATIERPALVAFAATASDSDGSIAKVEFFQGTTKVGEDSTAPYTFSWDAPAGTYSLTAQAIDNGGARTTSAARSVSVTGSGGGLPPAAPTIALSYPSADSTTAGGSGRVPLEATVADANNDPLHVTFYGRPKATSGGADFTVAVMPDTQYYTDNNGQYIANWRAQATWMVNNRVAQNIVYCAHVGDVTQLFDSQEYEWVFADGVMKIIENPVTTTLQHGIPWGAIPGNHDLASSGNRGPNDYYNKYFGPTRFNGRPYFGAGITATDNHCNYTLFSGGGMDFVVVNLRHRATSAMISWGDGILKQFPNRRAIVTSHEIINDNGATWSGSGQAIFDGLKNNANLFLMLCGHKHEATGENRRSDVVSGRTIHTIVQDYQDRSAGGGGWFRTYRFSPATNTISAKTINAVSGNFETDANSQFSFAYPMSGGSGGTPGPWVNLGTTAVPAGGTTARLDWIGLTAGTQYEWYAAVSDGGTPVSTTARTFTMSSNTAPTVALTGPANGSTINLPATVNFTATASDTGGSVSRVEFFANGQFVGQDTTSPYAFNWSAPAGVHSLTVVAVDNLGARTASSAVSVTVAGGNNAPTVALISPANGDTIPLPNPVNFAATASDSDGTITKDEFWQGTTKLGEATSAPYTFAWAAAPGSYNLTAIAQDNNGARTTSAAAAVTVTNQAPVVTLTAPANGAEITLPASPIVSANANDADGSVASVEFYRGNILLGTDSAAPFEIQWTPTPGSHTLTARAIDNHGASTVSAAATVTVTNPAPTVAIVSPFDGGNLNLPGPLVVDVAASDESNAIAKVAIFVNGQLVAERTAAPFTFNWSPISGSYVLTATAEDNFGSKTTSAPVVVTVANPNNTPPAVAITSPANGQSVNLGAPVTITATASDSDGVVTKVEFFRGMTKLGERSVAPFTINWTPDLPGSFPLTAVAHDNDGGLTTSAPVNLTVSVQTAASVVWVGNTVAPTITGPLTAANAAAGGGLTNFTASAVYGNISANGWSNSYSNSNTGNDYFEFALSPSGPSPFLVRSLRFNHWSSSSTNPHYFRVFYSLDNFATRTQLGGTNPIPANTTDGRLTNASSPNPFAAFRKIVVPTGSTLKFRIYAWAGSTGTYLRIDNFAVNGVTRPILRRHAFEPDESGLDLAGGQFFQGNTGSSDRPAAAPQVVRGSRSYGVTNGSATLTSGPIRTKNGADLSLAFRLAALAIGSSTEGMDADDTATVAISPDGGATWQDVLRVAGNNNAYHSFGSGIGTATAAYTPGTAPVTAAPAGGGSRTTEGTTDRTDGFGTVEINGLPAVNDLRYRITLSNNSSAERWLVDDIVLQGFVAEADAPPLVTIETLDGSASEFGTNKTLIFRVSHDGPTVEPLDIHLASTGTAASGADFTGFSSVVTIPAGASYADLVLTVLSDELAEGPESVVIGVTEQPTYLVDGETSASGVIQDHPFDGWRFTNDVAEITDDSVLAYLFGQKPGEVARGRVLAMKEIQNPTIKLRFPLAKNRAAITHRILWSRDLKTWHSSGETAEGMTIEIRETVVSPEEEDPETLEATATITPAPATMPSGLFFRVEAVLQR